MCDELDIKILELLQEKGKIGYDEMSKILGVPDSTVHLRVKKLEKEGYIRGYPVLLNPEKVGMNRVVFIMVDVDPRLIDDVSGRLGRLREVTEIHEVAGDYKMLVKLRVNDVKDLDRFIKGMLMPMEGVKDYSSFIALNTRKEDYKVKLDLEVINRPRPSQ